MAVSFGIVGLPNVGKSSLFNLLTHSSVKVSNYPFCTIDYHVGVVAVPDDRLESLRRVLQPCECIPARITVYDIAGLVKGAADGEGLGNMFLAHIREVDLVVHLLRAFQSPDVVHVSTDPDPLEDFLTVNTEIALADMQAVQRRMDKLEGKVRSGDKDACREKEVLEKALRDLDEGTVPLPSETVDALRACSEVRLISALPQVVVFNTDDYSAVSPPAPAGLPSMCIPVKLESEIVAMDEESAAEFLADAGRNHPAVVDLVAMVYEHLGMVTFYTFKNEKLQAWSVPAGTTVWEAAGKIHTDMQKHFARASVIGWEQLLQAGSVAKAREEGLVRTEGREYVVEDGDVVEIHF